MILYHFKGYVCLMNDIQLDSAVTSECFHSWHLHKWSADVGFNLTLVEFLIFIIMVANSFSSICFWCPVHTSSCCSNLYSRGVVQKGVKFNLQDAQKINLSKSVLSSQFIIIIIIYYKNLLLNTVCTCLKFSIFFGHPISTHEWHLEGTESCNRR